MPHKKKKHQRQKPIEVVDFFRMHREPTDQTGYSPDDEREDTRAWHSERERQKTASTQAGKITQSIRQQQGVLLGEEHDYRATLNDNEAKVRAQLEEVISEQRIEREWIEFQLAIREETARQESAKKGANTQLHTQQMLHRSDIADKETEQRISLFSGFMRSTPETKTIEAKRIEKEKLEADRKKAAERAKAYEERMRKSTSRSTQNPSLFKQAPAPLAATAPAATKEAEKKGGWWPW